MPLFCLRCVVILSDIYYFGRHKGVINCRHGAFGVLFGAMVLLFLNRRPFFSVKQQQAVFFMPVWAARQNLWAENHRVVQCLVLRRKPLQISLHFHSGLSAGVWRVGV